MRLFVANMAPYPRRVTLYLAEKGLDLERYEVDLHGQENMSPAFLEKNPSGKIPVLELDDGNFLPESAAIIEYLEEKFPSPSMLGATAEERGQTRATDRVASEFFTIFSQYLTHTSPLILQIHPDTVQYPEVALALQPMIDRLLDQLEDRMGENDFLAGPTPTIADCTLYALMEAAYPMFGYEFPARCPRLRAWYARFSQRPSTQKTMP